MSFVEGNLLLNDVGTLDDVQINAQYGTLLIDNPILCIDSPVFWSQRKDSLLQYNSSQVKYYSKANYEERPECSFSA